MRTLAFIVGVCIAAVGALGVAVPSSLVRLAQPFVASGSFPFYLIAVVRIAFGLLLIAVASTSRSPRALRVLGFAVLFLGVAAAVAALVAVRGAQDTIEWWPHQASGLLRLTAALVLALGGFVAYACAPGRRTA